jgi:hypothetical protein
LRLVPAASGGPPDNIKPLLYTDAVGGFTLKAITDFQQFHFGIASGRIDVDGPTLARLREEAWRAAGRPGPPPPGGPQMAPKAFLQAFSAHHEPMAREEYVQKARWYAQDGITVDDVPSIPGDYSSPRKNWKLLKAIYEETVAGWPSGSQYENDYKMIGLVVGPMQWCGVFATFVLRRFLQEKGWGTAEWVPASGGRGGIRVNGVFLPQYDGANGIEVGDICITSRANIHHVIVASKPQKGSFETVEGNFLGPPLQPPPQLKTEEEIKAWKKRIGGNQYQRRIQVGHKSIQSVWYRYSPFRPASL